MINQAKDYALIHINSALHYLVDLQKPFSYKHAFTLRYHAAKVLKAASEIEKLVYENERRTTKNRS